MENILSSDRPNEHVDNTQIHRHTLIKMFLKRTCFYITLALLVFICILTGTCTIKSKLAHVSHGMVDTEENFSNLETHTKETNDLLEHCRSSGFWTFTKQPDNAIKMHQPDCKTCSDIYLNATQIKEIREFLESCFKEEICNTTGRATTQGYPIVCDPVVHLNYSKFKFCIDYNGKLNSAFVEPYVLYYDILNILYDAQKYFNLKLTI